MKDAKCKMQKNNSKKSVNKSDFPEGIVENSSTLNIMRNPKIFKIVINIGVGEAGEKLVKGEKVINLLTGRKAVRTISKTTNKDLGIRKGMPIGCKLTLRKKEAEEFLKKALWVRTNRLPDYSFDNQGNLNFGIEDYTDFPEMKYSPDIGIFGMDINVVLKRPGFRIHKRRQKRGRDPHKHQLSREEAMEFIKGKYKIEIVKTGGI